MRIVIIGNGIAGITAAITLRKLSACEITVISGESAYFYARTALMYLYLGQLKFENIKGYEDWFWTENRITLKHAWVEKINFAEKTVSVQTCSTIPYDKLLIASGSKPNFPNLPGPELKGVHGLYTLQDLARIEAATATCGDAVIVGGGLVGIELAEMLHARNIKTTMLLRDDRYWGKNLPGPEATMIANILKEKGIDFRLKTTLQQLEGDEANWVKAVHTSGNERLPCTFVGITTGVKPNLDLVAGTRLKTNRGILINEFLETNLPDIYAAGDCAELTAENNVVEQLWYTARMQGETVAHSICGNRMPYRRGIPFNSAKFFHLEFQSYGLVNPENLTDTNSFFWQLPGKNTSIRINYEQQAGKPVCGFVLMGIRFRQEVCESWIREGAPLEQVLENLRSAFFDPEFAPDHTSAVIDHYRKQFPESSLKLKAGRRFSWF